MKRLLFLLPLCLVVLATGCDDGLAECPDDNLVCSGVCIDPGLDRTNCGACGNVCGAGFECIDGACACPGDEIACDGVCTRTAIDGRNCGACGNVCGTGEICSDGTCVPGTCPGLECEVDGQMQCIADLLTNEQHCGACGNVCPAGTSCLGGTCAVGDLYAACFSGGTVVPLLKESLTPTAPAFGGVDGPQSLALLGEGHLLALGSMDSTLYVIDRATMTQVGSITVGTAANQVLVRGSRAYVINSTENNVQVIDLADPARPATVDQVSTGEGTNPYLGAFDESGKLWVSLWLTNQVIPLDFAGEKGAAGAPIDLATTGVEGTPFPSGVAVVDGTVYVTLNNLDSSTWRPAGNGRLSTVEIATGNKGLIDLGSTCTNPGFAAASGSALYVACAGSFFDGEVALYDTTVGAVTERYATAGGPSRIALDPSRPGRFYVADSAGLGFFAIDPETATSEFTRIDACPAPTGEGAWEFNSDVLAAP